MDPDNAKSGKQRQSSKSFTARVFQTLEVSKVFPDEFKNVSATTGEDLFVNFRGLLILGRILGVIPICGVFKHSYRHLQFRYLSFPGITSTICVLLLIFNMTLAIADAIHQRKENVLHIANAIKGPLFAIWGLFIYSYFLVRRQRFIKIFKVWSLASRTLVYTSKDTNLYKTIVTISVLMFTSAFFENAILHMEFFEVFDNINGHTLRWGKETGNASILQMYYWRSHGYWNNYLGYHPILAVLTFFIHKFVLYGWNYIDVTSALFFRALFFKFKALCKVAEKQLLQPEQPMTIDRLDKYPTSEADRLAWEHLARDHDSLCEVLNAMNNFFSPILFVSYTVNIYFFCMQLLFGLNPEAVNHSIVHSIYAPWSFLHIIIRIFLFSLFASKINEYAHKIADVVMRCPVELYAGQIAKLDKRVNLGPKLGMTGLGCFVITKPFMLSILNVVFTMEIVLLQGLSTEQDAKKNECNKS